MNKGLQIGRAGIAVAVCGIVALAACSPEMRSQMQTNAEARGTAASGGGMNDWAWGGRAAPGFLYSNYNSIPQSPGGGG